MRRAVDRRLTFSPFCLVWMGRGQNRKELTGDQPQPNRKDSESQSTLIALSQKILIQIGLQKVIGYIPHFLRNFVIEGATVKKNITKSAFIFWLMPPKVPLRSLRHQLAVSNTYALSSVDQFRAQTPTLHIGNCNIWKKANLF